MKIGTISGTTTGTTIGWVQRSYNYWWDKVFYLKNLKSEAQLNKGKDQHKIKITIDNKTAALP